jgi:integrase
MSLNTWTKIKREHGLYRYNPSGQFFARVRFHGKLYRRKLETDDLAVAKRKLRTFRDDLERTDATKGDMSFAAVLDDYAETLQGAESTLVNKLAVIAKLKKTWFGCNTLPLRTVKPSQVTVWLTTHYGSWSSAYYNLALSVITSALDAAVADRIIIESPAKGLKYRRREQPIRLTPTFEQFKQIVADIRGQRFNAVAEQSCDFVEAMGLLGLGQAELANVKREHLRLDAGQIDIFRRKTEQAFTIPIYPQACALVTRLCNGKKSGEKLFKIKQARKAITEACRRLELPIYTHRSFRRLFVTRAIEKGIDVKVIAQWQGHRDSGVLILKTYSHVRPEHSQRMAALLTDGEPENVVPITASAS